MSKIFGEYSDLDVENTITTDNEYAKNYDRWRKKEELNKLKTKYGEELLYEDSLSSSDDDDEGVELTKEIEKQFFKTLSCLKNKDPRIYDENIKFFEDLEESQYKSKKKAKKGKPLYINDYERELILKKNGELSDSDEIVEYSRAKYRSPTYVDEQKKIKENFKKALSKVTEDEIEWGGMLKVRHKTEEEKIKEESEYKEWLAGQKDEIEDKEAESELKPLKNYWSNPDLDEGEKFLRDYILKKRFLNKDSEDYIPTYEEIIHDSDKDLSEDENAIEKQDEFEHRYNFRFEEPDQEFIKRYPRTMEHSLRKTDDRRKLKRAETKERKQKEMEQKIEEIKKLQELRRKEIKEKIHKLKEITGNENIKFKDEDLEGDFDPEAHDKKMQSFFNDEFYETPEGDQKPEFPDLDEYLEIENWEKWKGEGTEEVKKYEEENAPHCEDDDFNMDCDYYPQAKVKEKLIENSKGKKKRKRKSLFAKAVSQPKPSFDPNDKTYEEYLDEYYKFDCEDIIGNISCRFKYRKVVPNSFGLTIGEILTANDRELNKWCSLKKAIQHRPDHVEKYDQIAYEKKSKNLELKKKILPSLFQSEEISEDKGEKQSENKTKKKIQQVQCKKGVNGIDENSVEKERMNADEQVEENGQICILTKKDEKVKSSTLNSKGTNNGKTESKSKNNKKKKKKMQNDNSTVIVDSEKTSKKRKTLETSNVDAPNKKPRININKKQDKGISDARLSAYGINPKKFKNKLKYKKF